MYYNDATLIVRSFEEVKKHECHNYCTIIIYAQSLWSIVCFHQFIRGLSQSAPVLRGGALNKDKTSSREQAKPVQSKTVEDIKVSISMFMYVGICFMYLYLSFMNFKISMCLWKDLGIGRDGGSDCSNQTAR